MEKEKMTEVKVELSKPFVDFMKDYLAFFGSEQSLEDLCREMIYDDVKNLYNELHSWIKSAVSHIETVEFYKKYGFIGCVADSEEEPEAY